jgi:hypothetical protein
MYFRNSGKVDSRESTIFLKMLYFKNTDEDQLQFKPNNTLLQPVGFIWLIDTILLQSQL